MYQEDLDVVAATRRAIESLHRVGGVMYAYLFSPLHDDGMLELLRQCSVVARGERLGNRDLEAVTPAVFGRYLMIYSTDVDDRRRRFALRHGLGHVVAGHVSEPAFLSLDRNDPMSHEERVCDLFALADLAPAHMIEDLRKGRTSWTAINESLKRTIAHHTLNWPQRRVQDRAKLRIMLYREHGL
jgi:hypothetical protein